MNKECISWLRRAESALLLAKVEKTDAIFYEDLCFQLQQAAEKAIKALLIFHNIEPPKTHSFLVLIKKVETVAACPAELKKAIELEDYAVQTRYPGDYSPVEKAEYESALRLTDNLISWIKTVIEMPLSD